MTNKEAIEAINANYPPENYTILREALDMAIILLKAQEPRILTLDEIKNIKGKAFFLEERSEINGETRRTWWSWAFFKKVYISEKLHEEYFIFANDRQISNLYYPINEYGKDWRCWSGQPTDKQRMEVRWDEM